MKLIELNIVLDKPDAHVMFGTRAPVKDGDPYILITGENKFLSDMTTIRRFAFNATQRVPNTFNQTHSRTFYGCID
jgi:hypothetical protein